MTSSGRFWLSVALLSALTFAVYYNSFKAKLTLDAEMMVMMDGRVHEVSALGLRQIITRSYWFPQSDNALYRPLVTFSWLLNYAILGNRENAFGYHCVNFAFHLLNILLLWS